jgi:hypothetical protein
MAEKLEFDLKVGVNELQKALNEATTGSKKLGDTVSTALGVFGGGVALKGFALLGDAVSGATGFIKDSIKAAQEQENALNKLGQSLRATGEFSQQAVEDFSQFASELQKTSVFGDEVVISQLAVAKSLGATNQQAKNLVQAAANLSATFGGSLDENVLKLGKSLSGVASRDLAKIIPELKGLSEEALKSGEALNIVNQKFSGAAASELNTFSGATTSLANAFGDLQEEIGAFVTKSETVGFIINVSKDLIVEITDAIINYRTEQQRANGTLVETDGTLTKLTEKYAQVRDEIEKYQSVVDADKSKSLLQSLFSFDNAPLAKERIQALTSELSTLDQQITKASQQLALIESKAPKEAKSGPDLTAQELNKLKAIEAEKTNIIALAELDRQNFKTEFANTGIENQFARNEAEIQRILEFETQKKELEFQLAEEKAQLISDRTLRDAELTKIAKQRELEFQKIGNKALLDDEKNRIKGKEELFKQQNRLEQESLSTRLQYIQAFGNLASAVAKDGSKEQFAIQKASAIAGSIVATQLAAAQAKAIPPAPNLALAAVATKLGAINTAAIVATAIKGFANGGIVGATQGPDNQLATVRTGEMVLNADQQRNLFDMINSGSSSGEIVVQIDGREIARAVKNQVNKGFKIA